MRNDPNRPRHRSPSIENLEARIVLDAIALVDYHVDQLAVSTADNTSPDKTPLIDPQAASTGGGAAAERNSNAYGLTGYGQTVAVIDSGIAYDHDALGGGFGPEFRVVGGWDFGGNDADPFDVGSSRAHGTHVAGIIGSSDTTYPGLAPEVDLVALRVYNDIGAGYFSWVEDVLAWVHEHRFDFEHPITTVNLSLGAEGNSDDVPNWATLEDELTQLEEDGIFVAVAAGNSFLRYNSPGLQYPAVSPHVVPVSSVDSDGSLSYFSQRHATAIAAPGRNITSAVPDRLGDGNGINDDFASQSGTSAAAPYLAGASVLIREAFDLAGQTDVMQDDIYDVMRETADSVWDSVTKRNYLSLNLDAALDAVMPGDDYGSSIATAHWLGAVSADHTAPVSGAISFSGDVDYFRFEASQTGTVTFNLVGGDAGKLDWVYGGDSANASGQGALEFEVIAGERYVIGLGSNGTLTQYQFQASIASQPEEIDLGVVEFEKLVNESITGESWYSVTAAHNGILTIDARFSHSAGNIDLEIYDDDYQLVAKRRSITNNERVHLDVRAGETLHIRAVGNNQDVNLVFVNQVELSGDSVTVHGTSADEVFIFTAGERPLIQINGMAYRFESSTATKYYFEGNGGSDLAVLYGSKADESATLRIGGVSTLDGNSYSVSIQGASSLRVHSGGGGDVAHFFGSRYNDYFNGKKHRSILSGNDQIIRAMGFSTVYADAASGDDDRAYLYDSIGADVFESYGTYSKLTGPGFSIQVGAFDDVRAVSRWGNDQAILHGTAGDDFLRSRSDSTFLQSEFHTTVVFGFHRVDSFAGNSGNDTAVVLHVRDNDLIAGKDNWFAAQSDDLHRTVNGFDRVTARPEIGHTPNAEVDAVDYAFLQAGEWL